MDKISVVLRVFFEDSFWIGILGRMEVRGMTVCKIIFGPEPKDYEVHGFLTEEYYDLRFSPVVATAIKENRKNPERVRRQIRKELWESDLGMKAQQVLKLQQEQIKISRKAVSKGNKETKAIRQSRLKQQKKKEKHRGR